jgi:hypothetical protein
MKIWWNDGDKTQYIVLKSNLELYAVKVDKAYIKATYKGKVYSGYSPQFHTFQKGIPNAIRPIIFNIQKLDSPQTLIKRFKT